MAITPYIESEIKEALGGVSHRYVFSRGVKGLVQTSNDSSKILVHLSFPDNVDSLMWKPKRVLPLLSRFNPQAGPTMDGWFLSFPATVAQEALQELDAILEGRRFYA